MKNIEYLESFFRKHNLSGRIRVKYTSKIPMDDYMSDIIFEDGTVININDIIFDIISLLPEDVVEQWLEARKDKPGLSLSEWMKTDIHYCPKNIDTSSVKEYQKELTVLIDNVKQTIENVFTMAEDDGDSDEDDESGDE